MSSDRSSATPNPTRRPIPDQIGRGARVPGFDDRRCEDLSVHDPEPYENRRESAEVLDVEEPVGRILEVQVDDPPARSCQPRRKPSTA